MVVVLAMDEADAKPSPCDVEAALERRFAIEIIARL